MRAAVGTLAGARAVTVNEESHSCIQYSTHEYSHNILFNITESYI